MFNDVENERKGMFSGAGDQDTYVQFHGVHPFGCCCLGDVLARLCTGNGKQIGPKVAYANGFRKGKRRTDLLWSANKANKEISDS